MIIELDDINKDKISKEISLLDRNTFYPIGNDFFTISHGDNYFSFFEKIGKLNSFIFLKENTAEALFSIVTRKINNQHINYLCDFKKSSNLKEKNITILFMKYFFKNIFNRDNKYYGIHMNENGIKVNKIARLLSIFTYNNFSFNIYGTLNIYTFNKKELIKYKGLLENQKKGYLELINLENIKDIVLQSTGKRMDLIHLSFSEEKTTLNLNDFDDNTVFMFCTMSNSILSIELFKLGIPINSTATISEYNMENFNFEFISTNEI